MVNLGRSRHVLVGLGLNSVKRDARFVGGVYVFSEDFVGVEGCG